MLVMAIVLPESLSAFWAASSSTGLLHLAAAADRVVVVAAVVGGVVVVAGAAVEEGAPAEPFPPEEPHPAAITATSTVRIKMPMVVRRIASHPCCEGFRHVDDRLKNARA
jgi:hypothetical protein